MDAKEAQRIYNRSYYQKNKERIKAQRARYWEKKARQMEEEAAKAAQKPENSD